MKVSIVTTMDKMPWAGSEELWLLVANRLLEQGHELNIYYPRLRGHTEHFDVLETKGARVIPFGMPKRGMLAILVMFLGKVFKFNPKLYPIPQINNLGDFTLVSQGAILDGLPWLELLEKKKVPYSILCQANLDSLWPGGGSIKKLDQLFSKAKNAYFVSEDNLRLFRLQTGYSGEGKVVWNPLNPITPDTILPWPKNRESLKLAMVGRIEPYSKGQDLMLEVMSMQKWRDFPVTVTVFGNGEWKEVLEDLIRERKLTNISFGGFKKPQEIWCDYDALLLPSRHEGKSLAMLEAMWLGRPVISTRLAGAPEEIVEGETGFFIEGTTPESLDKTLENVWTNKSKLEEMGRNAAERIRSRMPENPEDEIVEDIIAISDI